MMDRVYIRCGAEMKTSKKMLCLFVLIFHHLLFSQSPVSQKIAILPFHSIGLDETSAKSAESIFRLEIGRLSTMDIVSEKRTTQMLGDSSCTEPGCAAEIGKNLNAGQVVICTLAALGEKIIVQYLLVDVTTQEKVIEDQITASHIEDLDTVMKRVAASIAQHEPAEKTAEVGVITAQESKTPLRRGTRRFSGFSFGYLYPQSGYDDSERSFAMDFRTGAEFNDYAAGMQLFIRKGFGVNIFTSYLFSRKDICPYVDGAFGFHWVSHEDNYNDSHYYGKDKKKDGFEVNVNSGIRLFHTYNFQILFNLGYSYTFNDYNDQAIYFTFGLVR
jgi:TolB-like protein